VYLTVNLVHRLSSANSVYQSKDSLMYNPRKKPLARVSISLVFAVLLTSSAVAQNATSPKTEAMGGSETITTLPDLTTTTAGEPLHYLSTPDPVVSSDILTVPPGKVSRWMVHPVPAYLYVLQGDLTLEFVDGKRQTFHAGQSLLQSQTQWHRGRNEGQVPLRFLAVFMGSKGTPVILHPPVGASSEE
jgi:mannose-6-phosphate isomerase-like protein (cupin superfamily)